MTSAAPEAIAASLARSIGAPPPSGVTPLAGGRNNRVFRTDHADGPRVLKVFHADPRDPRDRLAHEWAFLSYAAAKGVAVVPRPLAKDEAAHAMLQSYAVGRKLAPGEVTPTLLDTAVEFIVELNAPPRKFAGLPAGSEACFSLGQHLATVRRRVERLGTLDPKAPCLDQAARLVGERLEPAWAAVSARLLRDAQDLNLDLATPLPADAVILSPSDFGFHNALVSSETVTFIDFEYAGLDDVAKLLGDLFGQPDVPAPPEAFEDVAARLIAGLGLGEADLQRCHMLRDLYRVKWACIMLNDFLPLDSARRAFAAHERTAGHCERQLGRATTKLDEINALQGP
jgi:Ser/Thr protein kinase RdoA (MazF antagonist)